MTINAIVLDGNERSALAATRSLGKNGLGVMVGSQNKFSLSSVSKYCKAKFVYPHPIQKNDEFIAVLLGLQVDDRPVLFPMTDLSLLAVLKNRNELEKKFRIPFVGLDSYNAVSDKEQLFRRAMQLGLPVPKTIFSNDYGSKEELIKKAEEMGFPLVVKPVRSLLLTRNGWSKINVRYAADTDSLKKIIHDDVFDKNGFLLQEKVSGRGLGVFFLINEGKIFARFAHRRLREKPPSGGVSVLSESIKQADTLFEMAETLIDPATWHGVAMIEFKEDQNDNIPKLMEINGRFWGSLQLAVNSGVDFPYLTYKLAHKTLGLPVIEYKCGIKSRWELGDLDHFYIITKSEIIKKPTIRNTVISIGSSLSKFSSSFFDGTVNEVARISDPFPFVLEMGKYIISLSK